MRRHRPAYVNGPPAVAQMLVDADVPAEAMASIKYFFGGSAPMPLALQDALLEKYGIAVIWAYGASEFGGTIISWSIDLHREFGDRKRGAMGRPLPGIRLRIVDPDSGEPGFAIGQTGYLEAIVPALGPGFIRTTDLARIDPDGFVFHLGRGDGAIMRGGFKVLPETIASALMAHPAVLDAAVVGLPDHRVGAVPAAVVQLRAGHASASPATLAAFLRDRLSSPHIPSLIHIVEVLPRTASMKVDLAAVQMMLAPPVMG